MNKTQLDFFDSRLGLDRGRSTAIESIWYLVKCFLFLSPFPWPSWLKASILRKFGARVGTGVVLKPRVNIHFPWKLIIGDHAWVGEEVFLLNLEPISIGSHSCISQRAFLCTGNHNFRDPHFGYRNLPIVIGSGVWIGAGSIICPGVTVSDNSVVCAGTVLALDVPQNTIFAGNPATLKGKRWINE